MFVRIVFILASCLISGPLLADGVLTPSFSAFYFSETTKRNINGPGVTDISLKTKTTYTFMALGACYTIESICLGLKYLQAEKNVNTTSSLGSGVATQTLTGPALTLGYSGPSGFLAHFNYFFASKKQLDVSGETVRVYPVKTGYTFEVGYGAQLGSVRVGPLLGIYQFTYTEMKQNGVTTKLDTKEADDFLVPQVGVWVDL